MKRRALIWAGTTIVVVSVVHFVVPPGDGAWHWAHLAAQQLDYMPILMAAAWLGVRATLWILLVISALFAGHSLASWAGDPAVRAHQLAEITSFWIAGVTAAVLFRRMRRDLEEIRGAHQETLEVLARTLDLRERQTGLHSQRVRDYALLLADRMGLGDPTDLEGLAQGAVLHDIGKIGISDRILLKPGKPIPFRDAVDRIVMGRGTQFDPRVVEAFVGIPHRAWAAVASRHGAALREGREAAAPLASDP